MLQHIKDFQLRIGATPDGEFGKETLVKAMEFFKISKEQCANFFGQCYHETGGFKATTENTNYSVDRMLAIFKSDFDTNKDRVISESEKKKAKSLVGNSAAIANFVYANQNGNGNEASGDGNRYKGHGSLQLTGRANYKSFSEWIKDPAVITNPELVAGKYYFDSALFFFAKNSLWNIASKIDKESIKSLTKRINGGYNGLAERAEVTVKFYKMLS